MSRALTPLLAPVAAAAALVALVCLLPPRGASGAKPPAHHPKEPEAAAGVPADLNEFSLRVTAMERIVEFDLSPEQLAQFRSAAAGCGDARARTAAKADAKLGAALKELNDALTKGEKGEALVALHDKVDDLKDDEETQLDDDVRPTDAARAKAGDLFRRLKATQIAAYLAEHADEVPDPVEQMMDALADVRDPDTENPDLEIRDTSEEVGHIVAGLDGPKARQVADQVSAWIRSGRQLKDEDFAARRESLEDSARQITGDPPAMQVLTHWLENEVATLLSNPQLVNAIDALQSAGAKAK